MLSGRWQYRCIDLLSLIKTTRRDMVRARLLYAALVQLSPEVDFYVDNVYIGSKPPTTDSAGERYTSTCTANGVQLTAS